MEMMLLSAIYLADPGAELADLPGAPYGAFDVQVSPGNP